MSIELFRIQAYLRHRKTAVNEHGLHSPFVFQLYLHTVKNTKQTSVVDFETAAMQMRWKGKRIFLRDFGTGADREIDLYRWGKKAISNRQKLQVLSGLVSYFQPDQILELGTALGLSSLAMKMALPNTELITWEGSPELALEAKGLWEQYGAEIRVEVGSFEAICSQPRGVSSPDLVFIDGDHRGDKMRYWIEYFYSKNPSTVFVLDDIHWSADMEHAWKNVLSDPRWNLSIDLYHFGVLAPRKEQVKEHFALAV